MDDFPAWFETMVGVQGPIVLIRYSHFMDVGLSYSIALSGYIEIDELFKNDHCFESWVVELMCTCSF